jgi:hypothetical protein
VTHPASPPPVQLQAPYAFLPGFLTRVRARSASNRFAVLLAAAASDAFLALATRSSGVMVASSLRNLGNWFTHDEFHRPAVFRPRSTASAPAFFTSSGSEPWGRCQESHCTITPRPPIPEQRKLDGVGGADVARYTRAHEPADDDMRSRCRSDFSLPRIQWTLTMSAHATPQSHRLGPSQVG